jgi:hypothetical protein
VRVACASSLFAVLGCGGDDDGGGDERKPDTGYGAGEAVPAVRTCSDICARVGDCATQLCNEDTNSTRYDAFESLLAADCETNCDESLVNSEFTDEQWACLFQSSCREVFDYDECKADGSYFCR